MSRLVVPSIHLVTSRQRTDPDARTAAQQVVAVERLVDRAIDAGVDVVHVRERDLDAGLFLGLVSRIVARAIGSHTTVLVSERADVAVAAGADGVHLPSAGVPAERLRRVTPQAWIVGRSIHRGERLPEHAAIDYLLFGTVFPSESKPAGTEAAGIDGLADAVQAAGSPVIAIGGITPSRGRACLDAGAAGIAAIGAFLPVGRARDALGPRRGVEAFRAAFADANASFRS